MSHLHFQGNRNVPRDKLKLILFDWLKERGILGELQTFLRTKMVEKLQGSDLTDVSKNITRFTERDHAMNKMVYDYLKHNHMHYTMSVFASECLTVLQRSRLDDFFIWNDILNSLGIQQIDKLCSPSKLEAKNTQCLLNWVVETLGTLSSKRSTDRSSQSDNSGSPTKLMLNSQSQTDICVETQAIQTFFTSHNSVQIQTEEHQIQSNNLVSTDLSEEVVKLKEMLEKSQSALQICQSKLRESERRIEQLMELQHGRHSLESNYSRTIQSRDVKLSNKFNHSFGQRRVQEAFNFLDHVEGRLKFLDQKYQNVVGVNYSQELACLLPDF